MKRLTIAAAAAAVLVLIASCASTGHADLKGDWKNPEFKGGKGTKILAIVMTPDPALREDVENYFQMEGANLQGEIVASHRLLPDYKDVSKEEIMALVRREGFDRVLFARPVTGSAKFGEQTYMADAYTSMGTGIYNDPWSYYGSSIVVVYSPTDPPPSLAAYATINVEAAYFDTAGEGSIIWRTNTEVTTSREVGKAGQEFAHTIVKRLGQLGLI